MSYPPPNQGYPPQQQGAYPPPQQQGYPQQPGQQAYPPPQQQGYPPAQPYGATGNYPPPTNGGYPQPHMSGGLPQQGMPPTQTMGGMPGMQQGYPQQMGAPMGGMPPMGNSATVVHHHQIPPNIAGAWYEYLFTKIQPIQMQGYQRWFEEIDKDRSGTISIMELQKLKLPLPNVPKTSSSSSSSSKTNYSSSSTKTSSSTSSKTLGANAYKAVRIFDRGRRGILDYTEYCCLSQFLCDLCAGFLERDKLTKKMRLDLDDINKAFAEAQFPQHPTVVEAFFNSKTRPGQRPMMDINAFITIALEIAATKSHFIAKDVDRDQKLNMEEVMMVVAAVNTSV